MSNLVEHAKRELELLGEDRELAANITECVEVFSKFRHSGTSADIARHYLNLLLSWRTLTPITDNPDEWEDRTEISATPLWQNKRDSKAFSEDGGRTWYFLDDKSL